MYLTHVRVSIPSFWIRRQGKNKTDVKNKKSSVNIKLNDILVKPILVVHEQTRQKLMWQINKANDDRLTMWNESLSYIDRSEFMRHEDETRRLTG